MKPTRVTIRVKPAAARTRVGGRYGDALMVAVREPAVAGRATEAALRALAVALGVRRRDIRLVTGRVSRTKVVEVEGTAEMSERIAALHAGAER